MATRHFPVLSERVAGGFREFSTCECRKCGRTDRIGISAHSSRLPDQVILKKFVSRGWRLGSSASGDICPECANKREEKPVLKIVPTDQPREMQREDRRIIFEKLNEVYLDESKGYAAGWSDHRVSTDLGVPRKWVEGIREEMFGSVAASEDMSAFAVEAEALLKEGRQIYADVKKLRSDIDAAIAAVPLARVENIEQRLSKIDKLATEVRKLMVNAP